MSDGISIIIPARDEEAFIGRCLKSIELASKLADITPEIIVVLNRCTDKTEEIALEHGCKIVKEDAKNLAIIRNAGIETALGPLIITIDADSRMSKRMLIDIINVMQTGKYIGGGVTMYPDRISPGIALTYLCLLPYILFERLAGGLFFFDKSTWKKIGGFDPNFKSAEDLEFARRLKALAKSERLKFKILLTSWIITSTRKFDKLGDWYFIKNFSEMLRLLRAKDHKAADRIWYDFPRK